MLFAALFEQGTQQRHVANSGNLIGPLGAMALKYASQNNGFAIFYRHLSFDFLFIYRQCFAGRTAD
ncbi:hypothetical protein D3C80_1970020 [compost metagenome]